MVAPGAVLAELDRRHKAGGMRQHRPTPRLIAGFLQVPVKEVQAVLVDLRRDKLVRWSGRGKPTPNTTIELNLGRMRYNPRKAPAVGHARHVLLGHGLRGLSFVRTVSDSRGPLLVFRGIDPHGNKVVINVRSGPGDLLDVRWGPPSKARKAKQNTSARRDRTQAWFELAQSNPARVVEYDPFEEQLRAQRQAIYESYVKKLKRRKSFRNKQGRRIDLGLSRAQRAEGMRRMFAIGTGVQKKHGYLVPGTQTPTLKAMRRSRERMAEPIKLLANRQDYEETLALGRKGPFYRVTAEPTGYFVWPMPPGRQTPLGFSSAEGALAKADELNRNADPRKTRTFWTPGKRLQRIAAAN